jgi:hypothetical protein
VVGADEVVEWMVLSLSSVIDDVGSIGPFVSNAPKKI